MSQKKITALPTPTPKGAVFPIDPTVRANLLQIGQAKQLLGTQENFWHERMLRLAGVQALEARIEIAPDVTTFTILAEAKEETE